MQQDISRKETSACMVSLKLMFSAIEELEVPKDIRKKWSGMTRMVLAASGPDSKEYKKQIGKGRRIVSTAVAGSSLESGRKDDDDEESGNVEE